MATTMTIQRSVVTMLAAGLLGCGLSPPLGVHPVAPFSIERYSGTWYEIARLDHRFERGLKNIQASYQLAADGSVRVVNRGVEVEGGAAREAVGRALFLGERTTGSLKVSFFGPFFGGYHVAALDEREYQWALVMGPDRDYFWILSRTARLPAPLKDALVVKARMLGIDPERLIWTEQDDGATATPALKD